MKFDLVEINRLSPPELWDFGVLSALMSSLLGVIRSGVGGHGSALVYGRMVVRLSESLRAKTRDNLNMRIKAWVLQCPHRIAYVRRIIGETTIRKWRKNRLADYALSKYFGDWKRKFPHGFSSGDKQAKQGFVQEFTNAPRAYTWKAFALVKIVNVQGFLYRKPKPNAQDGEMRDAYYKLWSVELADTETAAKWTQPRQPRTLNPIRFTPDELRDELRYELEPKAKPTPETNVKTSPLIDVLGAPEPPETPKRIDGEPTEYPLLDWQPP